MSPVSNNGIKGKVSSRQISEPLKMYSVFLCACCSWLNSWLTVEKYLIVTIVPLRMICGLVRLSAGMQRFVNEIWHDLFLKGSVHPKWQKTTIFTYLPLVVSSHAESFWLLFSCQWRWISYWINDFLVVLGNPQNTLSIIVMWTIYSVESSLGTLILERHIAVKY